MRAIIKRLGRLVAGFFFFQAEDGIRDYKVTGVQTCALPICGMRGIGNGSSRPGRLRCVAAIAGQGHRSEEHTSELQSPCNLVCRLLLEKKKNSARASRSYHATTSLPNTLPHPSPGSWRQATS